MNPIILCTLLAERIDPTRFQIWGGEVKWHKEPTDEEAAIVDDVIANYETLAAGYQAGQMKTQAIDAIQNILDSKAKEFGFDSIHTAAVWTISKNPDRKARADALVAWGDSVWDFAEAEWAKQEKGESVFKAVDEFLGAVPKFG